MKSHNLKKYKYLIVGAGFFGSVVAERVASFKKEKVLVIDKRDHVGGNSYSRTDPATGIEVHKYGTHIFHTDNLSTWNYIKPFMKLNPYRHRVFTTYKNSVYGMPINLDTINRFFGLTLRPHEAREFIRNEIAKERITHPENLEEKAISLMGRSLYEAFIKGYTLKQWGTDPKDLPADTITRLPFRTNYNSDYYDDPVQGVPIEGYDTVFEKLLSHHNITLATDVDYFRIKDRVPGHMVTVFTGPIDSFFCYKHGELGWRTIDFSEERFDIDDYQGTAVNNYAEVSVPFTRIHEFKHLHPEREYKQGKTLIYKEFSRQAEREDYRFYPINRSEDVERLRMYDRERVKNVFFGGRLGRYRYLDMDDTITEALLFFEKKLKNL